MRYEDYLRSEEWQQKRQHMLKWYRGKCMLCASRNSLNIHHLYYRKNGVSILGRETDQQLMILCRECHFTWHKLFGYKVLDLKIQRRIANLIESGVPREQAMRDGIKAPKKQRLGRKRPRGMSNNDLKKIRANKVRNPILGTYSSIKG